MTIKTNYGNFGGFKNLEIFMRTENIMEIEILQIDLLSIPIILPCKNYTYSEVLEIINRED